MDLPPPPPRKKPSAGAIVAMIIGGLFLIGAIGNALDGDDEPSGSSSSDDNDALTERTCEIFRDIAFDAEISTTAEIRDRLKDLYDGYGQAAPADIAVPLRAMVAAMTAGDDTTAAAAIDDMDAACTSRGL